MNRRGFLFSALALIGVKAAPSPWIPISQWEQRMSEGRALRAGIDHAVPMMLAPGERVIAIDDFHVHESREAFDRLKAYGKIHGSPWAVMSRPIPTIRFD